MVNCLSRPHTAAVLDDEPGTVQLAACPMCHTPASLSQSALDAGGAWRCVRCGQHWDAARLAVVAGYTTWVVERDRRDRWVPGRSQEVLHRGPSTEPVDGTP